MFTAFVLICSQHFCFSAAGPAFESEEACVVDFAENGIAVLTEMYPSYTITRFVCYEWKKEIGI